MSHASTSLNIPVELNMILFLFALLFILRVRYGTVACGGRIHTCTRPLVINCLLFVVVMRFVVALFVVGLFVLIPWIFVALVVRMLTLRPMNVTGLSLEGLVLLLGGRLVGPVIVLEGVIPVPVVTLVGATLVEGSTMRVATLVAAIVVSIALIRKMANFVVIALRHLVAEFALCTKLDLLLSLLRERAVSHLRVVDVIKILADSRECLVAETSPTLEVPIAVLQMR
jgi:hypothetical protein